MSSKIILYTSHCPKCKVLSAKLDNAMIAYDVFDDVDKMIKMGITTVPILCVDGQNMTYSESIKWIKERRTI